MHLPVTHISMIIVLALMLIGCRPTGQLLETLVAVSQRVNERMVEHVPSLPAHPLYVLAVSARQFGNNQLVIVDADTWQITRRVALLNVAPWDFSRDPQGRIWIGYGAQPGGDTRVQVFASDGNLLKTMTLCTDPILPIHFAVQRAFVPCLQDGFEAAVVVIDLAALEVVQQVDIRLQDDSFLLTGYGGNEDYLILVGSGDESNRLVLLNTNTLAISDPLPLPPVNAKTILAYRNRFLMLNSVAESALRNKLVDPLPDGRPDLLFVEPTPTPTIEIQQMAAPGALWGVIEGDKLYAYHNAELFGFNADPFRAVSQVNLTTKDADLWPLPDGWNARDLEVVNGEILLTHSIFHEPDTAGLYRFDPATSKLTMLLNIPGAQRLLSTSE